MTLSMADAHDQVRSRFNTEITLGALSNAVKVQHDNAPDIVPNAEETWIRFTILTADGIQTEFGTSSPKYRYSGVAIAQLFIPIGLGDKPALTIADQIINAFKSVSTSGGVTFRTPTIEKIGREGQYWQANVNMPFFWRAA